MTPIETGRSETESSPGRVTEPAPAGFDLIVDLAVHAFAAQITLIALVDEDILTIKSANGVEAGRYPRAECLIESAVASDGWVQREGGLSPSTATLHPDVPSDAAIAFFAGVPIFDPTGQASAQSGSPISSHDA